MVSMRRLFSLSLPVFWLLSLPAFAAEVRAVADRDRLALGESLRLDLQVAGSPDGAPDLSVLDRDWEVLNRSRSSQISIVNGDMARTVRHSLTLMPRREGELTIPAVCFGDDCSLPLPIRVSATPESSDELTDAKILLEVEADAARMVSGQQLLFKVRVVQGGDLLRGTLSAPEPTGVDAVVRKLGEDRKYQTRRGDRYYNVNERIYAIFPQAAGTLRIPPLRFDGLVAGVPSRSDPFGRRGERVRQYSQPLEIEVLPPARDLGGRFWLPARSLRLQDGWQGKTPRLTVGEPATRTLTLTGEGLQAAQLPELQLEVPTGFKAYPNQPSRRDTVDHGGVTGILQQKTALVPTRPGRYQLPAIDLDWWDVAAGQWRRAHLDPVEIEVAPAAGILAGVPPAEPDPPEKEAVLAPGPAPGEPVPPRQASSSEAPASFWPWLSLALGIGWLGTLALFLRQRFQRPPSPSGPAVENPRQREKAARQAVVQAARNDDPRATRAALTVWAGTLWPEQDRPNLEGLRRSASDVLGKELDRLDRALYAPGQEEWTGDALNEALRQWQVPGREQVDDDGLPGLYPGLNQGGSK